MAEFKHHSPQGEIEFTLLLDSQGDTCHKFILTSVGKIIERTNSGLRLVNLFITWELIYKEESVLRSLFKD